MQGAPSQSFMPVIATSGTLEEVFPDVDPNFEPMGVLVLMQVAIAKEKMRDSELVLPEEVRATIQANMQVAKVISCGRLAFHNRNTGALWPEGAWVHPGDFVRIPRFGGDRWEVKYKEGMVMFVLLKDLELPGRVPRPLDVVAYV